MKRNRETATRRRRCKWEEEKGDDTVSPKHLNKVHVASFSVPQIQQAWWADPVCQDERRVCAVTDNLSVHSGTPCACDVNMSVLGPVRKAALVCAVTLNIRNRGLLLRYNQEKHMFALQRGQIKTADVRNPHHPCGLLVLCIDEKKRAVQAYGNLRSLFLLRFFFFLFLNFLIFPTSFPFPVFLEFKTINMSFIKDFCT